MPSPVILETEHGGGQVYFSANRGVVLFPGDCVTLRWQVDHIRDIYINDQPQIGSGENRMCITTDQPELTVKFQDDSQQTYPLAITILAASPLTWGIGLLTIPVAVSHQVALRRLIGRPIQFGLLLSVIILIFYLFFAHLMPLSETVASAGWLEATTGLTDILMDITLIAVLIAIAGIIVKGIPAHTLSPKHMNSLWGTGVMLTIGLIAVTIVLVNPLGMYFDTPYNSYQLLLRGLKTDAYNQLAQPLDILIMGSSRAFTLSPAYIQEKTGYTAYNMAIEGGRIEDMLIQARQLRVFPKVMLIEVQEGLPRQPNDIAARAPLKWLPYMSFDTALLTVQKRLAGLIDIHQLAEAIYTARYAALYAHQPKEWPDFDPDGFAARPSISAPELEQAILLDIGNIPAVRCESVDEASQADMNQLMQLAAAQHTAIVFYMSPWHPRYDDALLKNDAEYQHCAATFSAYMGELTQTHSGVYFLDYSRLESIGGAADESGYFDSQHMTAANSQRLIDHADDTLRLAYQHAALDS